MMVTTHDGVDYYVTPESVKTAKLENGLIQIVNKYNLRITFWRISDGAKPTSYELGGGLTDLEFGDLINHLRLRNYHDIT